MSSNPLRGLFGRREQAEPVDPARLAALTDAFFACERTMGDVAPAVRAARAIDPGAIPDADWNAVRDQYDQVISRYLQVTADGSPDRTPAAVEECLRGFTTVSTTLERFIAAYRGVLSSGHTAMTGAEAAQRQARVAATHALAALDQAPPEHAALASVRAAADRLAQAIGSFEAASGIVETRRTGDAVVDAAASVEQLLAAAPGLAADADRTVRSLDTRAQGLQTRLSAVPRVMSELLRDFSVECSEDLVDAPERVRADLDAAAADLDRARALSAPAPDQALAAAESARDRLSHADAELDRVFDRLTDLREVRRDPVEAAARVRFRVRDAQHFALGHNLVASWGSVLDAQSDRIDRAAATLERIHPDYWSYLTQLRAVDARLTEIIGRMRDEVAGT